jgi:hypothetical protein
MAFSMKLSLPAPGKWNMRTKINDAKRTLGWAMLLLAMGLSLPAAAQSGYPLRIRGSSQLQTNYINGNLVIVFQPGAGPAGNGLQPGEGSWLDRGFRPAEPHVLQQAISEDQAKAIADYLNGPEHYATFYCVNSDQGFFSASDSQPFLLGPRPNGSSGPLVWASVLNLHGSPGSSGGGVAVISGNRNGAGQIKVPDGKEHHEEGKDHHEGDKDKHDREKEGHDKDHHGGTGNHGIALVKPQAKPLVKQKNSGPPKSTPKTAPHPTPKKKK